MEAATGHGVGVSGRQNEEEGAGGKKGNGKMGCAVVAVVARGPPADGRQPGIISGIVPDRNRRVSREPKKNGPKAVLAHMKARGIKDELDQANHRQSVINPYKNQIGNHNMAPYY
jgi:hypothetical protein